MDVADWPKVTVLIPVYNKAPYLKDCLDSVFNGTWTDLEVVAVVVAVLQQQVRLLRPLQLLLNVKWKLAAGPFSCVHANS